jgi:hypothetical protein
MVLKRKSMLPVGLVAALVVLLLLVGLALSGPRLGIPTTSTMNSLDRESVGEYYAAQPPAPQGIAGEFDDGLIANEPVDASTVVQNQERVILKTAILQLVVDAADVSLAQITAMAEEMGGWVVSSSTSLVRTADGQDVAQGSITIRVPSDQLDAALSQIKSGEGVGTVEYESVTGQDVTQQYVDLNSRLTNLEAAETQLRQIMEDARRTEDVLNVYNQLVSLRGEIEIVRGQIQYYQESAAYSSITVTLTPKAIEAPIQIAGWSPGRTAESALAALINLLRLGADILITLIILGLPLVLVVSIPVWFVRRNLRRRLESANAA